MKRKQIIELDSEEEYNCIVDSLNTYKEWLEKEYEKSVKSKNNVGACYYHKTLITVNNMIKEIKEV